MRLECFLFGVRYEVFDDCVVFDGFFDCEQVFVWFLFVFFWCVLVAGFNNDIVAVFF